MAASTGAGALTDLLDVEVNQPPPGGLTLVPPTPPVYTTRSGRRFGLLSRQEDTPTDDVTPLTSASTPAPQGMAERGLTPRTGRGLTQLTSASTPTPQGMAERGLTPRAGHGLTQLTSEEARLRRQLDAQRLELEDLKRQLAERDKARRQHWEQAQLVKTQQREIERLRQTLVREEEDREDREDSLREQMASLQMNTSRQISDLQERIHVPNVPPTIEVLPPQPLPKLKIFTGLAPTNNLEATYEDWRSQAKAAIKDTAVRNPLNHLQRSLRGAALAQCEAVAPSSAQDLLKSFDKLFGEIKDPQELLFELYSSKQAAGQSLADLLTSLYNKLLKIKEVKDMPDREFNSSLFQSLSKACTNEGLARELRTRFGIPGEATPSYQELLYYLRRVEDLDQPRTAKRDNFRRPIAGQHQELPQPPPTPPPSQQTKTAGPQRPKTVKGYCYNCGEVDSHLWKECQNPRNPDLVRQREEERRHKRNQWCEKKGLPTIPLN